MNILKMDGRKLWTTYPDKSGAQLVWDMLAGDQPASPVILSIRCVKSCRGCAAGTNEMACPVCHRKLVHLEQLTGDLDRRLYECECGTRMVICRGGVRGVRPPSLLDITTDDII